MESFEEIAQTVDHRTESSSGSIHFFVEDIVLLCLYIAKLEKVKCERLFVGVSANRYHSVLGLGDVKNVVVKKTIYVSFVQKLIGFSS